MKHNIFILSEWTLLPLLYRVILRRKSYVLAVNPVFPPLKGILQKLASWALKTEQVFPANSLCPELSEFSAPLKLTTIMNTFATIEAWQDKYFRFRQLDSDDRYEMAFKQITCKYLEELYLPALYLDRAREHVPEKNRIQFHGIERDTLLLQQAWRTAPNFDLSERKGSVLGCIINAIVVITVTVYAVAWICLRTRLKVSTKNVFLAADYLGDYRDNHLYTEAERGGALLLVKRTQTIPITNLNVGSSYLSCNRTEGRFDLATALGALLMVATDSVRIFWRYHWLASGHFYHLATCPFKRAVMRALFKRYRPKFFWSRDEYNVEHILRRQELRRIGARSLGLMHGVQPHGDLNPRRRYIDFDIFYVFGTHLYKKYYTKTWATDMEVRSVGSFGFTRDQFKLGKNKASGIIAVFMGPDSDPHAFAEAVSEVASEFPEYRFLVKPKFINKTSLEASPFPGVGLLADNIETTTLLASDLIASARYVLSDASSVITEAIHLGVPALMLDMIPNHPQCLYRDFPNLCVTSGIDAASQLKRWETGTEEFDRSIYSDLINLSNQWTFDIVSMDMGLHSKIAQ